MGAKNEKDVSTERLRECIKIGKRKSRRDSRVFPALVVNAVHVAIFLVVRVLDLAIEDFGLVEQLAVAGRKRRWSVRGGSVECIISDDTHKHKTRSSFAYMGCPLAAGAMMVAAGGALAEWLEFRLLFFENWSSRADDGD